MSHLDLFAFANQNKYASQCVAVTHEEGASQIRYATRGQLVSHYTSVTLTRSASQMNTATQWGRASHGVYATQREFASPHPSLQPRIRR